MKMPQYALFGGLCLSFNALAANNVAPDKSAIELSEVTVQANRLGSYGYTVTSSDALAGLPLTYARFRRVSA